MGALLRGAKNAFRNLIRTFSVVLILALSIGLALIMLLSYQTVQAKIDSVKGNIGNTVTITPAGARGFEGGGEPLTGTQLAQVKMLAHVVSTDATLQDRLTPVTDTNLTSAIDAGTLGRRIGGGRFSPPGGGTGRVPTIPIMVTGLTDTASVTSGSSKLTDGTVFDGSGDANVALVGTALATKNNLTVGSSFTAYSGTTITVQGIYDAGNQFADAGLYMPLKAVQRLSAQTDQISQATLQVDSIGNVESVVSAVKAALGADKADVTSNQDTATAALAPLENIKNISLYSLIGALVAGAVITLLIMIMIVRERRREIGVLKAIGASNAGVVTQFISESLVLTLLGSVVGMVVGVIFSNPVLNALVTTSTSDATPQGGPGRVAGGFARAAVQLGGGGLQNTVRNLHATVDTSIILYGLGAAVLIAIAGSAIPAWLIAKVKPAEVMRGE